MKLKTVDTTQAVHYTPAVLGMRDLPPDQRPTFEIVPMTWDDFQSAQAESGYFDMKFDVESGTGSVESPQRKEAKLMGFVVARQVKAVHGLEVETPAGDKQITTGKELVEAISGMDLDGVRLLKDLYMAIQKRSHLEAGEKKA